MAELKNTCQKIEKIAEGRHGDVSIILYNNDECVIKEFWDDEDDSSLSLHAIREISMLKILNAHTHLTHSMKLLDIVELASSEDEFPVLGMIMPKLQIDLAEAIRKELLSYEQRMEIACSLTQTVVCLHLNDIIHRDIKCENIILDDNMAPVLGDFGIAKFWDDECDSSTHTTDLGTKCYMSPECVREALYNMSSDIWSLGVVLLCLVDNIIIDDMFDSDTEDTKDDLLEPILYILDRVKNLPYTPYTTIIEKILVEEPNDRIKAPDLYQSVKSLNIIDMPKYEFLYFNFNYITRFKEIPQSFYVPDDDSFEVVSDLVLDDQLRYYFNFLECQNYVTFIAAQKYLEVSNKLPLHCLVLSHKIYESEQFDINDLQKDWIPDIDIEDYLEAELEIFKAMNYQMFI